MPAGTSQFPMVTKMTDKKDPDQKNLPVDFDDDDEIIELTKEVFLKPKKDEKDIELQDAGKDVLAPQVEDLVDTDEPEPDSGEDEDIFDLGHTADTESEAGGTVLDLDEAFAGDAPPMGEDEIIASAIAESLGEDDEEPSDESIKLSDAADTASQEEDDVIILSQEDDERDGGEEPTSETSGKDEEVFDTEEEIELEYESNGDEYDFFAMNDKDTLEKLDTISMDNDVPDSTAEKEMPFDPLAELSLDSAGDDEIIAMEAESHASPELMAFDDEETMAFEGEGDLPDLADDLKFESTEDLPDVPDDVKFESTDDLGEVMDDVQFESTDDLQGLTDDMASEGAEDLPDITDEVEFEDAGDLPDISDEVEFEDAEDLTDLMDEAESEGIGDLPDLTDDMDFELADDAVDEATSSDDQESEDSDDIIARSVEQSLAPDEVTTQIDLAMGPDLEFSEAGETVMSDSERAAEEEFTAKTKEQLRALAEADDLVDFDDDADLEFEDEEDMEPKFEDDAEETGIEDVDDSDADVEVLDIEELEVTDVKDDDDIIEITEFDEHFPEEDEKKLEHAGVLSATSSDEDDFLELIEVDDDELVEDEEVIEFGKPEDMIDEDELDNFFSEPMEDEPAIESEEVEAADETPAMSTDMALATASTADEDDEFDFSVDSSDISQQINRLDTFLADDSGPEPEVASLPADGFGVEEVMEEDEPAAEESGLDDEHPEEDKEDEPLKVSSDQVDAIIERVINDKFGGKIEKVIYEAIEKAVSKEIDRLKGALLDTGSSGDDEND